MLDLAGKGVLLVPGGFCRFDSPQRHPDRPAELRHHLWYEGVIIGDLSMFYQFSDICLVQQMLSGVSSEKGITAGSTVIISVVSSDSAHS